MADDPSPEAHACFQKAIGDALAGSPVIQHPLDALGNEIAALHTRLPTVLLVARHAQQQMTTLPHLEQQISHQASKKNLDLGTGLLLHATRLSSSREQPLQELAARAIPSAPAHLQSIPP